MALMRKQYLVKKRSPGQTCCEFMSPFLLAVILVLGWQLSLRNRTPIPQAIYANQTLDFTQLATDVFSSVAGGGSVYGDVTGLFQDIITYDGPMLVPSLNSFIAANRYLRDLISTTTVSQAQIDLISQATGQFDALLNLGQLTFAPNTPEVQALVSSFKRNIPNFNSVFGGVFASEDDAVNYALRDYTKDKNWNVSLCPSFVAALLSCLLFVFELCSHLFFALLAAEQPRGVADLGAGSVQPIRLAKPRRRLHAQVPFGSACLELNVAVVSLCLCACFWLLSLGLPSQNELHADSNHAGTLSCLLYFPLFHPSSVLLILCS